MALDGCTCAETIQESGWVYYKGGRAALVIGVERSDELSFVTICGLAGRESDIFEPHPCDHPVVDNAPP